MFLTYERSERMNTSTSEQKLKETASNVLFFPTFGQPKVENPKLKGPKKGCISFQNAKRQRFCPETYERAKAQKALGMKAGDVPAKFSKDAEDLLARAYDVVRESIDMLVTLKKATAPLAK